MSRPHNLRGVDSSGRLIQVVGYSVIAVLVLSLVGILSEAALAGGTVTGLVLGFGVQATVGQHPRGIDYTGFTAV
jgi:small-conductance mechanosensitive channel